MGRKVDIEVRLICKTRYVDDCWLYEGASVGDGYRQIWYNGKMVRVNRLSCHLYHNADLNDSRWTANHKQECPNKHCWNPDHLYVGSPYHNILDQIATGKFHYGTDNLNGGKNFDKENWLKKRGK